MNQIVVAGIVTYNPDITLLKKNIFAIIDLVNYLIICDNGSANTADIDNLIVELNNPRIIVVKNGENKGIAFALNIIMGEGKRRGASWVITLDQDSIAPENIIESNVDLLDSDTNIAIVSCVIEDRNQKHKKPERDISNKYSEIETCITSASLTNVEIWQDVGGFDEEMFIDYVDIEYCIRARQHGYRIIRNNEVVLSHAIGNIVEKRLLWFWVTVRNHSAFRKYYQIKNLLYMHYKLYGKLSLEVYYRLASAYFKVIFYEENKKEKIKKMNQGLKDGFKTKKVGI